VQNSGFSTHYSPNVQLSGFFSEFLDFLVEIMEKIVKKSSYMRKKHENTTFFSIWEKIERTESCDPPYT
jgi:hypothetical protein